MDSLTVALDPSTATLLGPHVILGAKMELNDPHVDLTEIKRPSLESVQSVGGDEAISPLINCKRMRPLELHVVLHHLNLIIVRQAGVLCGVVLMDSITAKHSVVQLALGVHDHAVSLRQLPAKILDMTILQVHARSVQLTKLSLQSVRMEAVQVVGAEWCVVQYAKVAVKGSEGNPIHGSIECVVLSYKELN